MAVTASLLTPHGETRELYVRVNNVEASNHGELATFLFRGFISQEAFAAGGSFMWEEEVQGMVDVSLPLWPQAYAFLKSLDEFADATDC